MPELLSVLTLASVFTLVLVETLLKPISTRLTRRHAPNVAAAALQAMDAIIPSLIKEDLTRDILELRLAMHMTKITGEDWGPLDTDEVVGTGYDPRVTLDRASTLVHLPPSP